MNSSNTPKLPSCDEINSALHALYGSYGYRRCRVGKFEEYELYMRHKSFLTSERILSFHDTDGRLMALKPDVTLSIVKNAAARRDTQDAAALAGDTEKLYYTESVYRAEGGKTFSEITQTGLECIGCIDAYAMCEVIALAAESLAAVSPSYVLDISDMGILSGIIAAAGGDNRCRDGIISAFSQRNAHELLAICAECSLPESSVCLLSALIELYGPLDTALSELSRLPLPSECAASLSALCELASMLAALGHYNVNLDFSVVNDMTYYNGLIFRGFIEGIPSGVLSGGRYDRLLREMSRDAGGASLSSSRGAVGFAVYLDLLSQFCRSDSGAADTVMIYDPETDMTALSRRAGALRAEGRSVLALSCIHNKAASDSLFKSLPSGAEIIDMRGVDGI